MTKEEYKGYQERVSKFFEREGINNLSLAGGVEESFFSSRSCDCCGSLLGGDRWPVSGWNAHSKEIYCYDICPDCRYYAEYGQLDDMQMLEMEEQEAARLEGEIEHLRNKAFKEGSTIEIESRIDDLCCEHLAIFEKQAKREEG